jgi:hypothetical protein
LSNNSRCKFLANHLFATHGRDVRGSPLVRFILLAMALMVTGRGLMWVTDKRTVGGLPASAVAVEALPNTNHQVPFHLLLSSPARQVEINTGKSIQKLTPEMALSGTVEIDPHNPHLSLSIQWQTPSSPGEHRFAKITLEPRGEKTLTHVFDADGDIDDILEFPVSEFKP